MQRIFIVIVFLGFLFAVAAGSNRSADWAFEEPLTRLDQDTFPTGMSAISRHYGDSIVVRWAPQSAAAWILMQQTGYVLRKTVLAKNSNNEYTIIDTASLVIKPWTLPQWERYFKETGDTTAAAAAQLAYGKGNETGTTDAMSFESLIGKKDEQTNRHTFALLLSDLHPQIASGFGLRHVEKNVNRNHDYYFSIEPAPHKDYLLADTAKVLVRAGSIRSRDTAAVLSALGGDKTIFLFWEKPSFDAPSFTGYYIERSEDGKNFVRLNSFPYLPQENKDDIRKPWRFDDSIQLNYTTYHYRIIGINAFGDLSHPSNTVAVWGRDLQGPEPPEITEIRMAAPGTQEIYFRWDKKVKEPDALGYIVARGHTLNGPFEPLVETVLPMSTQTFTDKTPVAGLPNYYVVVVVDTAGNTSHSIPAYLQLEDHTPPQKPLGLQGRIDSTGKVTIEWALGKEADLAGYKVFFSNSKDHVFTPLTGDLHQDTIYVDSIELQTLTKRIYYQIIAYDRAMNASPASDILEILKPDVVPPVAPVIHGFTVSDSSVLVKWYPSPSSDVARQQIFRRTPTAKEWDLLSTRLPQDSVYLDTTARAGNHYEYSIEAFDSSGLHSGKSFALQVYVYHSPASGKISGFAVTADADGKKATLSWLKPREEVAYYVVYQETDGNGFEMIKNVSGQDISFQQTLRPGRYTYAIKAFYKNGSESALSELRSITIL